MNREFMKFMRENYSHIIKHQQFGKTVVDDAPGDEDDGE